MADLGTLSFSVHLQDMTDSEVQKIKNKLENLSVSLKIDGNNIKVSSTDTIKKQIEDAVKSVTVSSVKVDASSVKSQIEAATGNVVSQVKVTLLKDGLSNDIQSYLDTKSFNVKISITKQQAQNDLKNIGSVTVPVKLTIDKKVALDALKNSLQTMSVPIGIKMKSSRELVKDINEKLKNSSAKVGIDVNKSVLRSNVKQALKGETFKANIDLVVQKASVQAAIKQAFAKAGLNYNTSASDVRQNLIDTRTTKADAYADAQRALADLRRAQLASAQAATQQGNAMSNVNRVVEKQKGIMASLREQVANMYALYRIGRFLDGVIRISGEFQQQHVALQTILGDAQKADVIFERIKGLAVESPFKFSDLTKYTKQLAAFSIPYEELYDTLRRFGDLSAGLGVEMGRIILAFGQVRSAEFLKGTELRQFTEAGIPLVTELARRFTELEGEVVSVGDVFDRISKKQVTFGDVKAVLWDLTNEGGRSFNMQVALTDTLKGKLDKLIDSYEIFLSEIGNANNDVLGGTLDLLAEALKHWELIQDAVMTAVSAYGVYKTTLVAVAAVQRASFALDGIQKLITSYQFLHNTTKAATIAQLAFNAASKANPYVVLASGLATIAAGGYLLFKDNAESASEAIAKLNANIQKQNEVIGANKQKADSLVSVMINEKNTIDKRKEAYDKLKSIYPTLFKNMDYEQAMLLKEIELRGMVADAAKKETKEKLEASLADLNPKIEAARKKVEQRNKFRTYKYENGEKVETTNKKLREQLDADVAALTSLENESDKIKESIASLDREAASVAERITSRWFTEAESYVKSLPDKYKELMPKTDEAREEYFKRIGDAVDDVSGKIKELDKTSAAAKEVLPDLEAEEKAAKHIYTKILGGKLDSGTTNKELENQKKEAEKRAKEVAQAYANAVKDEIGKIASQWDLYKQLFEKTGDMKFAATAFKTTHVWDDAAKEMHNALTEAAKSQGIDWDIDYDISDADAKTLYKDLYNSWKEIKDRIERNGVDLKVNAADAISESKDFAAQIEEIERKLQDKLQSLRVAYADDPEKLKRAEQEAISKAEEEKTKVRFEEFKKSSDWVKVFDDLDRVSDVTLDNMIVKIEEFAKQAHLSEEVTKQLVEAMAKLRDEAIERNPFEGFKNAWGRLSYWKNYDVNAAYNKRYNDKTGKFEQKLSKEEIENLTKEANSDVVKASLEVVGKFDAVAKAADLLGGLLDSLGLSIGDTLGILSDVLGSAASGAKTGADIVDAFGIKNAGPWGAIAGAAIGMMSSLFASHDKALQREIEASEARAKEIERMADNLESLLQRTMGGIYTFALDEDSKKNMQDLIDAMYVNDVLGNKVESNTKKMYSEETRKKAQEALDEDSYFDAQMATLMATRDELNEQLRLEQKKKNEDASKISDYEQEIKNIGIEIDNLANDMANTLYGIDFKDWAGRLAESLVDAWASGEDAVLAYKNTVDDILRDVGVSVISQQLIEERLAPIMDDFMAQFAKDNGEITSETMSILERMYGEAEWAADATEAYLEGLKKLGVDLADKSEEASGGLSKSVQGVTEDTANLLGSYLNAIRQSVHVKQGLLEKLVSDDVPRISYIAEAQLRELSQIQANTAKNVALVGEIRDLVNRVVDKGSNKLKV